MDEDNPLVTDLQNLLKRTEGLKADLETLVSTNSSLNFYICKLVVKLGKFEEYTSSQKTVSPCPICFQSNKERNYAILPCMHVFCRDCSNKAIERHGRCPICRTDASEVTKIYL
jgi:regulator of replication initiation timing